MFDISHLKKPTPLETIENLDQGTEGIALDKGEASEPLQSDKVETSVTKNERSIEASRTIMDNITNYCEKSGIFEKSELENYSLPAKQHPVKEIRQQLEEAQQALDSPNLKEEDRQKHEEDRARLLVELQYSFVTFVKKMIPRFYEKVGEQVMSGNKDATKAVEELQGTAVILEQWKIFKDNSEVVINDLEKEFDETLTPQFFSELNQALYAEFGDNDANLPRTDEQQAYVLQQNSKAVEEDFSKMSTLGTNQPQDMSN